MTAYKKHTEFKNTKMKKIIISLACAASCLSLATTSHAVELNGNGNIINVPPNTNNVKGHKNPFTKRVAASVSPLSVPRGLPNSAAHLPMGDNVSSNFFIGDINESPEAKEAKFDWNNMKIVGYVNNNALLRVEDYKNKNNNNSGGNNNLNSANTNNEIPTVTLMATINEKFFFNKNYYTLKLEKNIFTVFNKNNVAMHTMMISGGSAEIIPKIAGGSEGQGEGQGGNSATGR